MNKTAIKNFAVQSRKDLILGVSQKAFEIGITKENVTSNTITSSDAFVVHGKVLDTQTKKQRNALIQQIQIKGYDQVMEEVAYTWFNRFIALRYMEVNGYLPSKIRVFTNHENKFRPELLDQAMNVEFEGVDKEKVLHLLDKNDEETLFKVLLIAQCNDMNQYLPEMFEKIGNYTELLLPDGLLKNSGVIANMISNISEEDWNEQVEIIGWLYQYYNSEVKDETYALLKKNVKVTKERLPSVTQLFTPDWIVRYMVENSLGRLWVEGHPNEEIKKNWKYYLEEAEQEPEVITQLQVIREEYKKLKPIDITVIDPCMGSGHILVYAFEVLMQIYTQEGYTERDAAKLILENNLYGLDIDDRAYQLSYFALMMKARKYNRRVLQEKIELNLCSIQESNPLSIRLTELISQGNRKTHQDLEYLVLTFKDAKEYGSILNVKPIDYASIENAIKTLEQSKMDNLFDLEIIESQLPILKSIIRQAKILSKQYHIVSTNPPYMGSSSMSGKLSEYVKKHYPDSKSDLFAVFIEKCAQFTKTNSFNSMITMHSWMFLSSFEGLRTKLINTSQIINMAHLGARAFDEIGGEVVQTTTYVLRKDKPFPEYKAKYLRLVEYQSEKDKELAFLNNFERRHLSKQSCFRIVPGSPIAYWVSERLLRHFSSDKIGDDAILYQGLSTTNNTKYVRYWFECAIGTIGKNYSNTQSAKDSLKKWFPFNKGGEYRKWYGNNELVVDYENDGYHIKKDVMSKYTYLKNPDFVVKNTKFYFRECLTWSALTSGDFSIRYSPIGSICADKGQGLCSDENLFYYAGFLNSRVAKAFLEVLSPTLDYNCGYVRKVPIIYSIAQSELINSIVSKNISISRSNYDSFETTWDFEKHPLVMYLKNNDGNRVELISSSFAMWYQFAEKQFYQLKANEEELNRIFIDIYGLQDELTPEVDEKDVTVRKADLGRDIRSFVSYAIGCMFGRYSLDVDGLVYAGGEWDAGKYKTFIPDDDNIMPLSEDSYFEDDLLHRFIEFVRIVYGSDKLEENLEFIANALGTRGQSARESIRNYLLNDFYKDHLKIYQKRPIYWMFESGKNNGFKALIYMHRYDRDTLAKMRMDYVHRMQEYYRTEIQHLSEQSLRSDEQRERVRITKEIEKLKLKEDELFVYEQKLHHMADQRITIDLDDGVVVNYAKFDGLVGKID